MPLARYCSMLCDMPNKGFPSRGRAHLFLEKKPNILLGKPIYERTQNNVRSQVINFLQHLLSSNMQENNISRGSTCLDGPPVYRAHLSRGPTCIEAHLSGGPTCLEGPPVWRAHLTRGPTCLGVPLLISPNSCSSRQVPLHINSYVNTGLSYTKPTHYL